ncbi:TIR domain-containing protein [Micromonospora sp. NPDC023737]|uniref:TIR domain-containing protein n=1 Tax=unclassified Micromonospora TaxID=2617518 RepID=UPI0033FFC217
MTRRRRTRDICRLSATPADRPSGSRSTGNPIRPNPSGRRQGGRLIKRDAFISYSHQRDKQLAKALERGLKNLARPWARPPVIRVFRDTTSLSANHDLWSSILAELQESKYLIYLASPEAAASPWVGKEIDFWIANRPMERLLIAVSAGTLVWDPNANDFDWSRTNALPETLRGKFPNVPLWVDLAEVRIGKKYSLRQSEFRDAVATLAAPLHGRTKDEIDSEDIRQHRNFTWVRRFAFTVLVFLLAAVMGVSIVAVQQRNEALDRAHTSASQAMAAQSLQLSDQDSRVAAQLALYSHVAQPTSESVRAVAAAVEANQHVVRHLRGGANAVAGYRGSAGGPSTEVAVSRDGSTMAYYSHYESDKVVHLYDIRTGAERRLDTGSVPMGGGWLEFSVDARLLALEVWPNQIEVWDVRQATRLRTLQAGDPTELSNAADGLWATAFSPSGRWLATTYHTSGTEDRQLAIWDARTGAILVQSASRAEQLAFDDRDRLLAWEPGRLRRFSPSSRAWTVVGKPHQIKAEERLAALFPDGRALISTDSNGRTELWDLIAGRRQGSDRDGGLLATLPADNPAQVVGARGGAVEIYDPALRSQATLGSFAWPATSVAASGDGRWVAVGTVDGAVTLFDAGESHVGHAVPTMVPKAGELTPDGRLALRRVGSTTEVWAAADDDVGIRRLGTLPIEFDPIDDAIASTRDGTRAVFLDEGEASYTARLTLWDLRTGEQVGRDQTFFGYDVSLSANDGIHFMADGVHIVVLGRDGPLLFDTRTWAMRTIGAEDRAFHAVAASDDGSTLALMDLTTAITVWRWTDGELEEIQTVPFSSEATFDVDLTVSARGDKVALLDGDGRLFIVDVESGELSTGLAGTAGGRATFSQDGRLLMQPVLAGPEVMLRFWDTGTAEPAGSWTLRRSKDVRMTMVSGRNLVTLASDGSLTTSTVDLDAWLDTLCGLVDTPKPSAPYDRYLSGLDINDPCHR